MAFNKLDCPQSENNLSNSIYSKFSNISNKPSVNNSFSESNLIFEFILEKAINYDLMLPSKEKDFTILDRNDTFNQLDINEEKIDKVKLDKIMEIISKYNK